MVDSSIILQIIARLRDELSAPLAKVKQAISGIKPEPLVDVGKASKKAAESAHEAAGQFGEMLRAATGFSLGLGIAEGISKIREEITDLVKESLEFEKAMLRVQIRSDDTSVSLAKFGETIRTLAGDFGKSAADVASAAGLVAEQTGLRGAEGIRKFLVAANELSELGLGNLSESVLRTAKILNTFEVANEQAGATMARVFAIAKTARTSFAEFTDILGAVGVNAHASGVGLEELGVIIAELSSRGVSAQQAAAGLNIFLARLSNPADTAREKIERYTGALGDNFLKTQGLLGLLEKIKSAVPADQQGSLFADLFGAGRTSQTIRALAESDIPHLRAEIEKLGNAEVIAAQKAALVESSLVNSVERSRARIAQAGSSIGDAFASLAAPLLEGFNESMVLLTKGWDAAVQQAGKDMTAETERQIQIQLKRNAAVEATIQAMHKTVEESQQLADEVERIPTLSQQLDVDRVTGAISKLRLALQGGFFGPQQFKAAEVPEAIRVQFQQLQQFLETNATQGFRQLNTEEKAALATLTSFVRGEQALGEAARQAELAALPAAQRQLAAIDDQIEAVRQLIEQRAAEHDGLVSNAELERRIDALVEQRRQTRVQQIIAEGFTLHRARDEARSFFEVFVATGARAAELSVKRLVEQTKKAEESLKDLAGEIKGNKKDVFEFAFRGQLQLDQDRFKEDLRKKVQPLLDQYVLEFRNIDPSNIDAARASMDSIARSIRTAAAEMSNFGRGVSGGLTDKLTEFADKTRQGYELAQTAVQSFTNATAQAIQGLIAGTAHLRDILRAFLSDIAGAISQILAQRLVGALLSGFSGGTGGAGNLILGGVSHAQGGVVAGGLRSFAPGGMAYGPQLAVVGDNYARAEAIVPLPGPGRGIPVEFRNGGASTIQVNVAYHVTTMDAKGVREVLVEHGRTIGDIAAEQIRTGRHAGLRDGVRGVR